MALLFQIVLLMADDSGDDHVDFGWAILATLVIMALCWIVVSVMPKGDKNSLWKSKDSEMDSSSNPAE